MGVSQASWRGSEAGWSFITAFEMLLEGGMWAFAQAPWENQLRYHPGGLPCYRIRLSSANILLCPFTEKEVNGLMEELFETVSNDFWVSSLVKFFSKLCPLILRIFSSAERSACVRASKEHDTGKFWVACSWLSSCAKCLVSTCCSWAVVANCHLNSDHRDFFRNLSLRFRLFFIWSWGLFSPAQFILHRDWRGWFQRAGKSVFER